MQFSRQLQYAILQALQEVYPDSLLVSGLPGFANDREFMGNLFYLQEHGMIEGGDIREPGQCRSMVDAQITHLGLDFLADDGGLQAILGKSLIKFEKDKLISLVERVIDKIGTNQEEGKEMIDTLQQLPPEALQRIIEHYLLESLPGDFDLFMETISDPVMINPLPARQQK